MSVNSFVRGIAVLALGGALAWLLVGAGADEKKLTLVYNVNNGGYVDVCGCKHKEVRQGSLTRRASFLRQLRATGRQLLLVDGGSALFPIEDRVKESDLAEAVRKAELIVEAYNRMGYQALAVGPFDIAAGLDNLQKLEKRARFPFLSANLVDTTTGRPYFKPHVALEVGGVRVGIIGLTQHNMGQAYVEKVAPNARLTDPVEAARAALEELRGKVDVVIVLSHLSEDANFALIEKLPEIEILVDPCIQYMSHHTWIKEEEWISFRGDTLFLRSDGQGARLGVIDLKVEKPRGKLLSQDRLVELDGLAAQGKLTPELEGEKRSFQGSNVFGFKRISLEPHHGSDPDIDQLIQNWTKNADPAQVPRLTELLPRKASFLTVENCKTCHEKQYQNWLKTKHADSMATLAQTGDEAAYDCVGCHSVGYGEAFIDVAEIAPYANVQCESCHGTNAEHAKDPKGSHFRRVQREDCITCHNKEVLDKEFDYGRARGTVQCPKG